VQAPPPSRGFKVSSSDRQRLLARLRRSPGGVETDLSLALPYKGRGPGSQVKHVRILKFSITIRLARKTILVESAEIRRHKDAAGG
jgi:hypothetical protein